VVFGFVIGGLIACFAPKQKNTLALNNDILDKSAYFFGEAGPTGASIDLNIAEGAFLQPQAPAFLVSGKTLADLIGVQTHQKEIIEYEVQNGDTIASLAEKFGITEKTIIEANNLSPKSVLKPGQKLIILPVSGVLHIVKQGDTLNKIAIDYKAQASEIIEANSLSADGTIFPGDILIIPGGVKPKVNNVRSYPKVQTAKGYFMVPIANARITQGLHWFNAVDFSNGSCGGPVVAAAEGVVQKTATGPISGNYITILHPNGIVTYYGHLSKFAAKPGQKVDQGQIIGYIGHTGYTIPAGEAGCHLHFDVRFGENPFAR